MNKNKPPNTNASRSRSSLSRREFVTTVAGTGAAFLIVPRRVLGRGFQAPSDTLNIAVAGINGMGAANAQAVMSQNIVAICDCDLGLLDGKLAQWSRAQRPTPRPPAPATPETFKTWPRSKAQLAADARWPADDPYDRLQTFVKNQMPRLKKYQDYREMLDKQKDLDAVIVATPDHMHAIIASASMDAGKHVYVQKPLCWSVHEARHLAKKAAAMPKIVTQMGNQRHSLDDQRRRASNTSSHGAIGEVREVHVWTNRPWGYWPQGIPRPATATVDTAQLGWDNRGVAQRLAAAMKGDYSVPAGLNWDLFLGVAPKVDYHPIYHPFNWRGWIDWGQGALGDMGAHLDRLPDVGAQPRVADRHRNRIDTVQRRHLPGSDHDALRVSASAATCRRSR